MQLNFAEHHPQQVVDKWTGEGNMVAIGIRIKERREGQLLRSLRAGSAWFGSEDRLGVRPGWGPEMQNRMDSGASAAKTAEE